MNAADWLLVGVVCLGVGVVAVLLAVEVCILPYKSLPHSHTITATLPCKPLSVDFAATGVWVVAASAALDPERVRPPDKSLPSLLYKPLPHSHTNHRHMPIQTNHCRGHSHTNHCHVPIEITATFPLKPLPPPRLSYKSLPASRTNHRQPPTQITASKGLLPHKAPPKVPPNHRQQR